MSDAPFGPLGDLFGGVANFAQLYKAPIIGGFFEDPNEAEKQRTMAAAANYFQQQRPEMTQVQMNMLNNRLSAYQGAADVMASVGVPTEGVQYAGSNPYGTSSYGLNPDYFTQLDTSKSPQQLTTDAYENLAKKNEPSWNPFSADHPDVKVPKQYDDQGNEVGYAVDPVNGERKWVTWSQYTGNQIAPYEGSNTGAGSNNGTYPLRKD